MDRGLWHCTGESDEDHLQEKEMKKRQNGCLRRPCKQLWKEEKWKAKEQRQDIPISTSLADQMVKHLPTMQETKVQSLGWEDLLEKEMATHSSILAWKILWTEKPGRLQSMGLQKVGQDWVISLSFSFFLYPFECRVPKIARRDKKAFLSDQCKEIKENNRMGKARDLFKKIRYQGNVSCKDGLDKVKKWYGSNRTRRY